MNLGVCIWIEFAECSKADSSCTLMHLAWLTNPDSFFFSCMAALSGPPHPTQIADRLWIEGQRRVCWNPQKWKQNRQSMIFYTPTPRSVGELTVLPVAGMIVAQWDSSLSVLPVARVMIAQWDSSLSVLPMARVMIAQWDSWLPVLPMARVMIAQWDCSLSVLPVARGMIAQWDSSLSVLPVARGMLAQWDSSRSVLPAGGLTLL